MGLGVEDLDLAGATTPKSACSPSAATDTLWLSDDSAFACAQLRGGSGSYASSHCISAATAELSGGEDTCESAADCAGGLCVELGGGLRRVCWEVADGAECERFSKAK